MFNHVDIFKLKCYLLKDAVLPVDMVDYTKLYRVEEPYAERFAKQALTKICPLIIQKR